MKTLKQIFETLENSNIQIDEYKEDNTLCGYELNTYTDCGVNQIIFLDFRDTGLNPLNPKDFLKVYEERINSIDINEEIDVNIQNLRYKEQFALSVSLQDFKEWKENLQNIFNSDKTAQQRQFEQTTNKLRSLVSELEDVLKLTPVKGLKSDDCQRTFLQEKINALESAINGVEIIVLKLKISHQKSTAKILNYLILKQPSKTKKR